ncbi:hypothetical protein [Roseibium sp.]|uniref:hypothetical protein n=1 Tax=Roseibium sp. TaxID=1936156 RepID=UPI003A9704BB
MKDQHTDPFSDQTPIAPEPFAIGYKPSIGDGFVYGGILFAVGFLVLGFFGKAQILASLALIPIFFAYWHYPMIDRGQPQLAANKDGLFLERLGFLKWDAISGLNLKESSVRSIELRTLEISLNAPLPDALAKPQVFPVWKAMMARNWKVGKAEDELPVIRVNLLPLTGNPEEIFARVRRYLPL